MFRYALLLAALAFQGCAPLPSAPEDSANAPIARSASLARKTFQVDEALRAFDKGCLSRTPSVKSALSAAAQEGLSRPTSGRRNETILTFLGDETSYSCYVYMRGEWTDIAVPFVQSALARQGFTVTKDFVRSSSAGPLSRGVEDNFQSVATVSRNGRNFSVLVNQQASNRTRKGNVIRVTVAGTSVVLVTADRVR